MFPTLTKKDEPEAKKRRQDMDDEEGKLFDTWMDEIKLKRCNFHTKVHIIQNKNAINNNDNPAQSLKKYYQ